jgi:hypothetical protein
MTVVTAKFVPTPVTATCGISCRISAINCLPGHPYGHQTKTLDGPLPALSGNEEGKKLDFDWERLPELLCRH